MIEEAGGFESTGNLLNSPPRGHRGGTKTGYLAESKQGMESWGDPMTASTWIAPHNKPLICPTTGSKAPIVHLDCVACAATKRHLHHWGITSCLDFLVFAMSRYRMHLIWAWWFQPAPWGETILFFSTWGFFWP